MGDMGVLGGLVTFNYVIKTCSEKPDLPDVVHYFVEDYY